MQEEYEESRRAAHFGQSWSGCTSDPGWRRGMEEKGLDPSTGLPYKTNSWDSNIESSSNNSNTGDIGGGLVLIIFLCVTFPLYIFPLFTIYIITQSIGINIYTKLETFGLSQLFNLTVTIPTGILVASLIGYSLYVPMKFFHKHHSMLIKILFFFFYGFICVSLYHSKIFVVSKLFNLPLLSNTADILLISILYGCFLAFYVWYRTRIFHKNTQSTSIKFKDRSFKQKIEFIITIFVIIFFIRLILTGVTGGDFKLTVVEKSVKGSDAIMRLLNLKVEEESSQWAVAKLKKRVQMHSPGEMILIDLTAFKGTYGDEGDWAYGIFLNTISKEPDESYLVKRDPDGTMWGGAKGQDMIFADEDSIEIVMPLNKNTLNKIAKMEFKSYIVK